MSLTIRKMQKYLKEKYKRTKPEDMKNTQRYFLKLIEEVGELAEAIRKNQRMEGNNIKGTIEEELSDVLYYSLMIANTYDIDLEDCFITKEELNRVRYGHTLKIEEVFIERKLDIIATMPKSQNYQKILSFYQQKEVL